MDSKRQKVLRRKLGQLFILGFIGDHINENSPIVSDIVRENLGGVILFDRHLASRSADNNIRSKEQVQQLTASLQKTALENGGRLIIAVDQEGGKVNRFKAHRGFPATKTAAEYGRLGFTATRQAAAQTAAMLASMGINLNFAPVADLAVNPNNPIIAGCGRSFSAKPQIVADHCRIWIQEHKKHRIASCLKHFPGHGSSSRDTHLDFTDISTTWHKKELLPYKSLIREGRVDSVMVGHLFLRQMDAKWVASLSSKALSLLRDDMQFDKPIFSDDMQMKAITAHYGFERACVQSIKAGVDALIIGNNLLYDYDILPKTKEYCLYAVEKGILSERRIDDAFQRMQRFKEQLL